MHHVASAGAWTKRAWRYMEPDRMEDPQSVSVYTTEVTQYFT